MLTLKFDYVTTVSQPKMLKQNKTYAIYLISIAPRVQG